MASIAHPARHGAAHRAADQTSEHAGHNVWARLAVMSAISFVAMYALMYTMVDSLRNVLPSVNQVYMAGMMTAAMVIIEVLVMAPMYKQKTIAIPVVVASAIALAALVWMTRQQVGVSDDQFLRSMIPHHAGAILMCNEADIRDPEIQSLCDEIVRGQQTEIDLMKRELSEIESR